MSESEADYRSLCEYADKMERERDELREKLDAIKRGRGRMLRLPWREGLKAENDLFSLIDTIDDFDAAKGE